MPRKRGKRWAAEAYDPVTRGKRHLGTFETQREAKQVEAAWRLKARRTGRETCDQFAARWTADYPRPQESTNRHNHERVKQFAKDFKGVRLADVDRPAARAWAMLHPSNLSAVRAMFGDAMRDGIIDSNPFTNLRLPGSRGRKDLVALTERELHALADVALDPRMELGEFGPEYRAMILFAGYVGLRPGELFALRREDVRGEMATVERARNRVGVAPTKSRRSRTVIVPPPAQDALADVPLYYSGLLFESPSGSMYSQSSHFYYWKRLRMLAGRPGLELYALRHTACTLLLERGATPGQAAVQLGHDDGGRLVQNLYGHPDHALIRQQLLGLWVEEVKPLKSVERKREVS